MPGRSERGRALPFTGWNLHANDAPEGVSIGSERRGWARTDRRVESGAAGAGVEALYLAREEGEVEERSRR